MQENFAVQNQINLYPNPAKDYFIFEIPSMTSPSEVSVIISDIYGREVSRVKVNTAKTVLDVRAFEAGIYFYRAEIDDIYYSGKFVVQR